ncbi:MAG: acyltransferase [Pseudomonadota bacterium]
MQLFWTVSGAVFFYRYLDPLMRGTVRAPTFAARRFARLYPLHLATLLLVAGLQAAHQSLSGGAFMFPCNTADQFVRQLFLASEWWSSNCRGFNYPIWTVSLEVLAYALFLGLALLSPRRWVIPLGLGAAMLAWQMGRADLSECLSCFFLGGIVVRTWHGPGARWRLVLGLGAMLGVATMGLMLMDAASGSPMARAAKILLMALIVWLALAAEPVAGLVGPVCAHLGLLTYAIYLSHFPLQLALAVGAALGVWSLDYRAPGLLFGYLVSVMVVAWLSYRLIEQPGGQWLRQRLGAGR